MASFFQIFIIAIVSFSTGLLIYYKIPVNNLNQLAIFLLISLLLVLSKVIYVKGRKAQIGGKIKLVLVFLTAFLTQIVVVSTGGFYSTLLIIIHIYTLGSGFLLQIKIAITFLFLTLVILGGQLYWDQNLRQKFHDDPGIAAIYLASFIIIIPLAQFIMKTYNLKDKMTKVLGEYLNMGQQREESILSGLNEFIFISDKNLHLISINESAEKFLKLSNSQIQGKPFLETINIIDNAGVKIDYSVLPVKEILEDKVIRIIEGMFLVSPAGQKSPVIIQIKPIKDAKNRVSQFIFIIRDARLDLNTQGHHKEFESVLTRYQQSLMNLKKAVSILDSMQAKQMVEILSHVEDDMRLVLEMEDHPLKEKISFADVAFVAQGAIESKEEFAASLGVDLEFILSGGDSAELAWLDLQKQKINPGLIGNNKYTVSVDPAWLKLLIQKLLDMSILLVSCETKPKIELIPGSDEENILIQIMVYTTIVAKSQIEELFIKDYGNLLNKTNLKLGSGVEGFLAHAIAVELKLDLSAQILELIPTRLVLTLTIPTQPK